jgi:oxygen-independent coproporphyrinogen-3 oxidase
VLDRNFSLYVHIPYCLAKCPYCDFNSHAAQSWPEADYTEALCSEMAHFSARSPWSGGRLSTIFFGGGTPSLFAPASIQRLLDTAFGLWPRARGDVEITLEANPGTLDTGKLEGFRRAGVSRVSFGVQSFVARHLHALGRIHDAQEAINAVRGARSAGFEDVSLDLIFALPEQHLSEWEADLQQACELTPDHLSAYNLTYEEGTPFHQWRAAGRLQQLSESTELAMFARAQEALAGAGYVQYEISNYAREGHQCRHNLNYWRSGAYLGIGAGAHSYTGHGGDGVIDEAARWGQRWSNRKNPGLYIEEVRRRQHAVVWSEYLDEAQARGEFVFLGLRCLDGFDSEEFRRRFGRAVGEAFPHVDDLCRQGLLVLEEDRCLLTERGLHLADSVFATFV